MKRQIGMGEDICKTHKGFISRIYKGLLQINKEREKSKEKWARDLTGTS